MAGGAEICKIIIAIFLPPVAVLLERGCGADLLINILLTLLGHIPGVIHAIYLILHDRERRKDGQTLYIPPRHQHNNEAMYGPGPDYGKKNMPPAQPVYREQPVTYNQDNIQPTPPTYGDYTERDIAGHGAAPVLNEKHEYAPVTATPSPQHYQNYSTKGI
jgi:uncharacterized membrane protein YqaE (UPF0057 family)